MPFRLSVIAGLLALFAFIAPATAEPAEIHYAPAGNSRASAGLLELARLWLRWQPDSALSVWLRQRVGDVGGRIKKIVIVALARKLLVALWRFAKEGVIPEGAKMKTA